MDEYFDSSKAESFDCVPWNLPALLKDLVPVAAQVFLCSSAQCEEKVFFLHHGDLPELIFHPAPLYKKGFKKMD